MNQFASKTLSFPKGALIFRQGAERNVAYLIKQGVVSITRTVNNRRVLLARLGEGEIFGEMAIINKARRTATATAEEHCELLPLDEGLLEGLLAQGSQTVRRMIRQLASRLAEADRRMQLGESRCVFLTVCRALHLLHGLEASRGGCRVDHAELCRVVQDLTLISRAEIEAVLERLCGLGLAVVHEEARTRRSKAFTHRSVSLPRPESFLDAASALPQEVNLPARLLDMEYLDLPSFAAQARTTPEALYGLMARGEAPGDLFFLHRERGLEWWEREGGRRLAASSRRRGPEEFEDLDDLLELDNATLEGVFRGLGYFHAQAACALAGEAVREKILSLVGRKAAQAIRDEGLRAADLTPEQAGDLVQDILEAVRVAKRVEKKPPPAKKAAK